MSTKSREAQEFDVCLSFAGENRVYVRKVADRLRNMGVRVFFDEYEEVGLWGKDLYEHLDDVYRNSARYCVIFASRHYARKVWANHERRSAQERALKENREYILPARFDNTAIPGLRDTVGYINLQKHTPASFAETIRQKTFGGFRNHYLPPVPDRLFKALGATSVKKMDEISSVAESFFIVLKRMSGEERALLFHFFRNGCPAELPRNVHINIDLLRRVSGFPQNKILRLLGGVRSLGFSAATREDHEDRAGELGSSKMLVLEWQDLSLSAPEHTIGIASAMVLGSVDGYCDEHGQMAWLRLDFSQLASPTRVVDVHPMPANSPKKSANKALRRMAAPPRHSAIRASLRGRRR